MKPVVALFKIAPKLFTHNVRQHEGGDLRIVLQNMVYYRGMRGVKKTFRHEKVKKSRVSFINFKENDLNLFLTLYCDLLFLT